MKAKRTAKKPAPAKRKTKRRAAPPFNRTETARVEASNAIPQPGNRDRAFRIAQIEPEYFGGVCDTKEDFVTDLLTDVRHYCDVNGLDFAHRDSMAYQHYAEEHGAADAEAIALWNANGNLPPMAAPATVFRYSDGNTYTDYPTLAEAEAARTAQNGGTITPVPAAPAHWIVWQLAPDSDPEERYILTSLDGEQEHPLNLKFSSGVEACNFLKNNPQHDTPPAAPSKLQELMARARAAMDGDSNDAEHDALFALLEFLQSAPPAPAKIAGGLDQDSPTAEAYRDAAKREHVHEGECEIDPGATVSQSDDGGAYIAAWVWVNDDEAKICRTCRTNSTADGEGYDGECGECVNKRSQKQPDQDDEG